jgi:hypothetical protein
MGYTWMHMDDTHGQTWTNVGWIFFENFPWVKCPMGIHKGRIPHYLSQTWKQSKLYDFLTKMITKVNLIPNPNYEIKKQKQKHDKHK